MDQLERARPLRDAMDEYENNINFNEQIMGLPVDQREQLMPYYVNDNPNPNTYPEAVSAIPVIPVDAIARLAEDAQGNPTAEYRNNILAMRADQANPNMTPTRQERTFAGVFNRQPQRVAPEPPLRQRLAQATIPEATEIDNRGIPFGQARLPFRQDIQYNSSPPSITQQMMNRYR